MAGPQGAAWSSPACCYMPETAMSCGSHIQAAHTCGRGVVCRLASCVSRPVSSSRLGEVSRLGGSWQHWLPVTRSA